jgi:hypothetical protein
MFQAVNESGYFVLTITGQAITSDIMKIWDGFVILCQVNVTGM